MDTEHKTEPPTEATEPPTEATEPPTEAMTDIQLYDKQLAEYDKQLAEWYAMTEDDRTEARVNFGYDGPEFPRRT